LIGDEGGAAILTKMEGQKVSSYKFSIADKAINMAHKFKVKNNENMIDVDPALLFQRLSTVMLSPRNKDIDLLDLFSVELSPYPASLAKSQNELHQLDKPALLSHLAADFSTDELIHNRSNIKFVIDGGYLIHKLFNFKQGFPFSTIASACCENLIKQFGKCGVVFDNYPDKPTKKDMVHMARDKDSSKQLEISESSILSVSREIILGNSNDKQGLIKILTGEFRKKKIAVCSADSDADTW